MFAAESSLQEESRKLGRLGDELEEQVAGLGTGDGQLTRPDRFREPPPPLSKKPNGSDGSGDPGQSRT